MEYIKATPHDPEIGQIGDCFRCCIAAIMGLPKRDVPHFFGDDRGAEGAFDWVRSWLSIRGLVLGWMNYYGEPADVLAVSGELMPDVPLILCGNTRTGTGHAVVVMGGQVVMDPSGAPIAGPADNGLLNVYFIAKMSA